jgi:HSP20 family protein
MAETEGKERKSPAGSWQSFNPFDTARDVLDRVMETFLEPIARLTPPQVRMPLSRFTPRVDVIEEDEDVRIDVEAPGMSADDLTVTIDERSVVIRGEKKPEKRESKGIHRAERAFGAFRRVVPLPVEVDKDAAEATFKNGVLTIIIPKSHDAGRKVPIRVEEG